MSVNWQPQPSDFQKLFSEQNPWHDKGAVPDALAPAKERDLANVLWQSVINKDFRRHQMILGPRRAGKTTVMYQTVRHLMDAEIPANQIWWLRLDHPLLLSVNLGDLTTAILHSSSVDSNKPIFLMLDEVNYSKDWDLWLKTFYDENWPVKIVATSSATAGLRKQRLESGVGRWEEHHLMPCQLTEFLGLLGQNPATKTFDTLADRLCDPEASTNDISALRTYLMMVGGFPELLLNHHTRTELEHHILESQRVLRGDAVERAIYKDIPQTSGVENPLMLERLLYALAGQISGILSPRKVGQELGIAQPTFDRYLSYLEQSYLIFTLTNYSGSEFSVQRRGRKLYFVDTAVRNAALHRGLAPLSNPVETGLLVDNLVASSLKTLAMHSGVRLHHWRDGNHEVDLIFDDPRQPLAFEIASSPNHTRRGLMEFVERYPRFAGHLYLVAPQLPVIQPNREVSGVGTLPLDRFLLAVGEQAHHAMRVRLGVGI